MQPDPMLAVARSAVTDHDARGETGELVRSVADLLERLDAAAVGQPGPRARPFPTGFDPLDGVLDGGVRAHDLALVGGAPGVGKTIATLQWARNIALSGDDVVYACYEHDERVLLWRLLCLELGEQQTAGRAEALRTAARDVAMGNRPLRRALADEPALRLAYDSMDHYASRLRPVRVSGARTGIPQLGELVAHRVAGRSVLIVDYLQKVAVRPEPADEGEKVLRITEGLKDLALVSDVAVIAVVAAETVGTGSRRLRLQHLRGSSALAYECDVAILLNDKTDAVSKVHLAYDPVRAATFKHQVVFTVEKNRGGPAPMDLEFRKDFASYRFEPRGGFVAERLADERLDVD